MKVLITSRRVISAGAKAGLARVACVHGTQKQIGTQKLVEEEIKQTLTYFQAIQTCVEYTQQALAGCRWVTERPRLALPWIVPNWTLQQSLVKSMVRRV